MADPNKKPRPSSSAPTLKSFHARHSQPANRLYRLLLILFTLTILLAAYFLYRPLHKSRSNSWWDFETGSNHAPRSSSPGRVSSDNSIEGRINDLAKAFGIPPSELASAIAVAVNNYIPPESAAPSLASGDAFPTAVLS